MTSNFAHNMKRVVAGVLALILVAGALPNADVGAGGLFGGTSLTAYADEQLYTFKGGTYNNGQNYGDEKSLFAFDPSYEFTGKIASIEAWVNITGNPTSVKIQVDKSGEYREMDLDVSKGIHKYVFICADIEATEDNNYYTYSQIIFDGPASETYGELLGYKINFNDSTSPIQDGFMNYPEFTVPTNLTATDGQTLANVTLPTVENGEWTWDNSSTSVGEAGTNTFSATFTPNDSNLKTVTNIQVPVTVQTVIKKDDINVGVDIQGWTFGNEANTPEVTGNTGNGEVTFKYKAKGADDSTYTETVPTDAGTYVVKAEVAETTNYNGGSATTEFSITKGNINVGVTLDGWTYGDEANTPNVTGNTGNGTVTFKYKAKGAADSTYTTTVPTNAGTYVVKAEVIDTTNYKGGSATAEFTIAKADITAGVTLDGWVAGVEANTPEVSGNTDNGTVTIKYKAKGADDSTYTETVPTEAGDYVVKAEIAATTNYKSGSATDEFTIAAPEFETPTYLWSYENNAWTCNATRICTNAESLTETESGSISSETYEDPSCTAAGKTKYTATFTNTAFETQYRIETDIPASGHSYGEPEFIWDDENNAVAKFTCGECDHVETLTATVTSEITKQPTCTEEGERPYTAKVTFGGEDYTGTKVVSVPAKGHRYTYPKWSLNDDYTLATAKFTCDVCEAVEVFENIPVTKTIITAPTYTSEGSIEYWYDESTGKYFADAEGKTEITKAQTVIKATGHTYGEPVWNWPSNTSATATFKCIYDDDTQVVKAKVTSKTTPATYTAEGKTVYTATAIINGKNYTDTKTVTIDKLNYTVPKITYVKGNGGVQLDWTAVDGAESYAVVQYINNTWTPLAECDENTYILKGLTPGTQYKVAVVTKLDGKWFTDVSNAITVTPNTVVTTKYPVVNKIEVQNNSFRLSWDAVEGAEKYCVAYYSAGKWRLLDQFDASKTSYTRTKVPAGRTYTLVVGARINGKWDASDLNQRAVNVTVK
ncbi:hypothetical protein SAMN02910446_03528 [Ruminococcus sp. YE78]|nr:hypothetical protein SAMN02910446_03528 [Ruminococcus sp. YE78]